jgi:hypothetical protein
LALLKPFDDGAADSYQTAKSKTREYPETDLFSDVALAATPMLGECRYGEGPLGHAASASSVVACVCSPI